MRILAIETSCDETSISVVEGTGGLEEPVFTVLSQIVSSQIKEHQAYGGVVPNIAKREHQRMLMPVLSSALTEANVAQEKVQPLSPELEEILTREPDLLADMHAKEEDLGKPDISHIAVTTGPGLEPALWVGINFARALGALWNIPVVAVNHMEGHIVSSLLQNKQITFPAVALLISGGHTELIEVRNWCEYSLLGMTRDDAVGEAYDKVARILGLPYPGGPEIDRLAKDATTRDDISFPRPMLRSNDLDFSFSGLKTAVKYYVDAHAPLDEQTITHIAKEFQNATIEVIVKKTHDALANSEAKTLIVGGGVIASRALRGALEEMISTQFSDTTLLIPELKHCGDNASMIAAAAYIRIEKGLTDGPLVANGSETLAQ